MSPHEAITAIVVDGRKLPGDFPLRCPCGAKGLAREWQEERCGPMDGYGHARDLIRRAWRTKYFDAATGREFCSARCALVWNDFFARPCAAHTGADPRPVVSDWWYRPTADGDHHAP